MNDFDFCEYSPEVKAAQDELQRIRDVHTCQINLEEGLAEFAEAKLEKGLSLAKKLGMNEEGKTISKADKMLKAIKACRDIALKVIDEIKSAVKIFGITQKIQNSLKEVIEEEQKYEEAKNIPEVIKCLDYLDIVKKENNICGQLMQACKEGAWTNDGITCGDYGHYQGKNAIDVTSLRDVLREVRNMDPMTQACRGWRAIGNLVLSLRSQLYEAVGTQDVHLWRNIEKSINEIRSDERNNDPTIGRLPRHPCPDEITAAEREVNYQKQVQEILTVIITAIKEKDEQLLETTEINATKLNMKDEYNTEMKEARQLLTLIKSCRKKMSEAIQRVDINFLDAAIQQAESFKYETIEVDQCRQYRALCLDLRDGMQLFSVTRLKTALEMAAKLKCNPDSLIIVQARQLQSRISECEKKAKQAIMNTKHEEQLAGTTNIQYKALQEALSAADALGGLIDQPEIKEVRTILEKMNEEEKLHYELSNALARGAWLNHHVQLGDFSNYQTAETIKWDELEKKLTKCDGFVMMSAAARKDKRLAAIVCNLRKSMAQAVGTRSEEKWKDVKELLEKSPGIEEFTLAQTIHPELVAARRESQFQLELYKMTTILDDGLSKNSSETLACGRIQAHKLHLQHFPLVLKANTAYEDIMRCRLKAKSALQQIKFAQENCGMAGQHQETLKNILARADDLGGLRHYEEIKNSADCFDGYEAEMKVINSLELSMKGGLGWLNAGVGINFDHGDYDKYQSKDTIDSQTLSESLRTCETFGTLNTYKGRRYALRGKILCDLRKALISAVKTQDIQAWQAVEEVILKSTNSSNGMYSINNEETMSFLESNSEIKAAQTELMYQKSVQKINTALQLAVSKQNDSDLRVLLHQAKQLNMNHVFNKWVKEGQQLLGKIKTCTKKMKSAMENREEKDLREACSFADSFEYTTEEVEKCKTMRDNIIQLNEETDLINAIKNGMRFEKGWLNSGVMHGDYDHYQKKRADYYGPT